MAVKRRDAKVTRRTAEKIHPKNSLFVQGPSVLSTFYEDRRRSCLEAIVYGRDSGNVF